MQPIVIRKERGHEAKDGNDDELSHEPNACDQLRWNQKA
jgi:hypothetical protein